MKLLNRTIRAYLCYLLITLLIAIPLFYIAIRLLIFKTADETLRKQLQDTRYLLARQADIGSLPISIRLDGNMRMVEGKGPETDSIYDVQILNEVEQETEPYREIAGRVSIHGKPFALHIQQSLVERDELLFTVFIMDSVLLLAIGGGMIWINRKLSRKIWQPFYVALKQMRHFQPGQRKLPSFDKTDITEFQQLNEAISELLERNTKSFAEQREFTENASHELQTPLAILQGKLELLMQTQGLTADQAAYIQDIEKTIRRISKLHAALLLLVKIDNDQFPASTWVNISEMLIGILSLLEGHMTKKDISLTLKAENVVYLFANPALIEILFTNLLTNAIRYNHQDGTMEIVLDQKCFVVKNTGIDKPLGEHIFERFYHSNESGQQHGVGLGLAIVKRISEMSGYAITYTFERRMHKFSIGFPDSPGYARDPDDE